MPSIALNRQLWLVLLLSGAWADGGVPLALQDALVNHYTFDSPVRGQPLERDLGSDATDLVLLNGAPRISDPAWGGSQFSLETGQRNTGPNDDWKAGVWFESSAESTLAGVNGVSGVTIAGWFKPLGGIGDNPSPNTNTGNPFDDFNAFGLAGYLRGDAGGVGVDGHAVRALIEVINGKVTALGRRLDSQGGSGRRYSEAEWYEVMPPGEWTHLTATFDFDLGDLVLYRNGLRIAMGKPDVANWEITEEYDTVSATNPAGIKIGGSHPNDSEEQNPFNGRIDELTFFNRSLAPREVHALYRGVSGQPGDFNGDGLADAADYVVWRETFGSLSRLDADADGDGEVGTNDLEVWRVNYGQSFPIAPATATPEPASLALAAVALLAPTCWPRRSVDLGGVGCLRRVND